MLNMKLQRTDQSVSWGFNVQGGKEFNCPLMIQKITPASLAERCSIRAGDYILRIGSLSTEHLTHNQARDSIIRQGNVLELTLQRFNKTFHETDLRVELLTIYSFEKGCRTTSRRLCSQVGLPTASADDARGRSTASLALPSGWCPDWKEQGAPHPVI